MHLCVGTGCRSWKQLPNLQTCTCFSISAAACVTDSVLQLLTLPAHPEACACFELLIYMNRDMLLAMVQRQGL